MAVNSYLPVIPVNMEHLTFTHLTKAIGLVTKQVAVIYNEIGADF